jgi:uncharacterized membrane protein
MRHFFRSTAGGKAGMVDGLNLFFGALLGANLGTMQGLQGLIYFEMILLLAGTVIVIRMLSTSERRTYMLISLAIYVILVGGYLLWPAAQPKGVAPADLQRLAMTLGVWIALVLAAELKPIPDAEQPQ